jgi:excisionase family DNA binding protein
MPTRSKAAPIAASSNSQDSPQIAIPSQRWFTIAEAAVHLRLSDGYVRHMIHGGEIRASRIGNEFRLDRQDLDRELEKRKKFFNPYKKGTRPAVARRWAEYRAEKQSKAKRAVR